MTVDSTFTTFPVLTTERMRLRAVRQDDAEAVFAFKSNLEVTRHYGQEPHGSVDDTGRWIRRLEADYQQRVTLAWSMTLRGDDQAIGVIMLWNIEPDFHCAELGYEMHPAYQGRGLMFEAAAAVLTCGFCDLGLHRIEADPLVKNTASVKMLRKLGFTHEGTLRERVFFRGEAEDQMYFGLLSREWPRPA